MNIRLVLSSAVLFASCADAQPYPDNMSMDQAFAYCGTKFEDFRWSHSIDGTIYITPASSLSPVQSGCMDRWASRDQVRHIYLSGTKPLDEADIFAKAEACGFDVKKLVTRGTKKGRRVVIAANARDPVTRELRCMLDWADHVDAPLDLLVRKADHASSN